MTTEPSPHRRRACIAIGFAIAAFLALRPLLTAYTDFGIYLDCARELVAGEANLYRDRGDIGAFLYPHVVLLPLAAIDLVLPEKLTRILYGLLLAAAATSLVVDALRTMRWFGPVSAWRIALLAVLFGRCITQNLTNAQLSLVVAACVARGVVTLANGRDVRAGIAFGVAIALKLTPAIFVVALPAMGRVRAGLVAAATTAALVLVAPLPFLSTSEHLRHLGDFHDAVLDPLFHSESRGTSAEVGPSASIRGTLDYLLQPRPRDADGRTLAIADLDGTQLRIAKLSWTLLLLGIAAFGWIRARQLDARSAILVRCAITVIVMSLLSPLTRVYHLAAIAPAAALLCAIGPGSGRVARTFAIATWVAFAVALPLRQRKLLGDELWWTLDNVGLIHFGLVAMLVWCAAIAPHANATEAPRPAPTP